MQEIYVEGSTLPVTYHTALKELWLNGDESDCLDWNTRQKEISVTMRVRNPLGEPMISKLFIGGPKELEQYREEILDGILDFEVEKGNWTYTYHDRMVRFPINGSDVVDQVDFVIQELKRNPSSRRAVINIRDNGTDPFVDDPACMQHIQYFIRKGRLDCYVLFRSNDACKAAFMNAFALIMLQKKIADELGVEIGTYTHRANSFHCYENDYNLLLSYSRSINASRELSSDDESISYYYNGDDEDMHWKDLMEEYVDEIQNTVDELKNR